LRAVGRASIVSALKTACLVVVETSTVGASPVTVMVSSSAPIRISASTTEAPEPLSATPSRLTVLKPRSVNVTE
jgi:hypothetical protein